MNKKRCTKSAICDFRSLLSKNCVITLRQAKSDIINRMITITVDIPFGNLL